MPPTSVHSRYAPEEKFLIDELKWSDHFGTVRNFFEEYPEDHSDIPLDVQPSRLREIQDFMQTYYGPLRENSPDREVSKTLFLLRLPSVERFLSGCYRLRGWMFPFHLHLIQVLEEGNLRVNLKRLPEEAQDEFFECVEVLSPDRVVQRILSVMSPKYQKMYHQMVLSNEKAKQIFDRLVEESEGIRARESTPEITPEITPESTPELPE
jgi:hypothetical protein